MLTFGLVCRAKRALDSLLQWHLFLFVQLSIVTHWHTEYFLQFAASFNRGRTLWRQSMIPKVNPLIQIVVEVVEPQNEYRVSIRRPGKQTVPLGLHLGEA